MAGMDWFRWHHGTVSDAKFQLVAKRSGASVAEVIAVWAVILEAASQATERGLYGDIDTEATDCALGLVDGQTAAILGAMQARGLASDGRLESWEKRQPKREREDNSTDRVRAFRAKSGDVTPGNASEEQETPRGEESREDKATATSPAPAADPCPHQQILDAYHRILPELVQMKLWTEDRQKLLRARWREDPERQNLAWWEDLFRFVRECPHLMGQNDRGWQATLEWIIRPKNFPKVIEGNYK